MLVEIREGIAVEAKCIKSLYIFPEGPGWVIRIMVTETEDINGGEKHTQITSQQSFSKQEALEEYNRLFILINLIKEGNNPDAPI